ncbi:MAG: patatin-like phospholipase family protein [Rhodanobacteraceae bacterium]|nr:MAG: patatin-like phospholipase family protein [Rhodanobacteraceae bacterium]
MQPAAGATETCVLVLQGGGALGAYQAGVCEQLNTHGFRPHWVAGVSIGAINAAIIAGNPPERRVQRLHEFWELITSGMQWFTLPEAYGGEVREAVNESRAAWVAAVGAQGFFEPRFPPGPLQRSGTPGALSYYDTAPLRQTLERLVDFDLINTRDAKRKVRLSVGAVNVATGNYHYFDSGKPAECGPIDARHIMASGALPPGFPPVEIDGEYYWDGGVVSNTPLQYVLAQPYPDDMLVIQVDLFSARGPLPQNLNEVAERVKDIRYSSRTRLNTDRVRQLHELGEAARRFAARLPPALQQDPDLAKLTALCAPGALTIMHLIYRSAHHESQSKDYEFSRQSMLERWQKGMADMRTSLEHPRCYGRSRTPGSITVLDLTPKPHSRKSPKETA